MIVRQLVPGSGEGQPTLTSARLPPHVQEPAASVQSTRRDQGAAPMRSCAFNDARVSHSRVPCPG